VRRTVFLDTSYFASSRCAACLLEPLLALIRKKDSHHEAALSVAANYTGSFVTTDLVLVEFANSLSQPPYRATATTVIEKIRTDGNINLSSIRRLRRLTQIFRGLQASITSPQRGAGNPRLPVV
jgi:hypothetical protein